MRVQDRPSFKSSAGVALRRLRGRRRGGARAFAERPASRPTAGCSTPGEAALTGAPSASDRRRRSLVLGFESADHPVDAWMERALELCRRPRRRARRARDRATAGDGADAGRRLARGVPARALPARHCSSRGDPQRDVRDRDHLGPLRRVPRVGDRAAAEQAVREVCGGGPRDAAASRTCIRTARRPTSRSSRRRGAGRSSSSGTRSRRPPSEAVIAAGGTITHHHAVGRDHRPWYDRQRPDRFAARAARPRRRRSTRGRS